MLIFISFCASEIYRHTRMYYNQNSDSKDTISYEILFYSYAFEYLFFHLLIFILFAPSLFNAPVTAEIRIQLDILFSSEN